MERIFTRVWLRKRLGALTGDFGVYSGFDERNLENLRDASGGSLTLEEMGRLPTGGCNEKNTSRKRGEVRHVRCVAGGLGVRFGACDNSKSTNRTGPGLAIKGIDLRGRVGTLQSS